MRIQHNIMAMSAYRNYTNNVSAMKKNLEKLSSGYKINRAGDDAAGLAISEKMRAQITGLETAQKNAKDGISLVQTAEGALTEVHDMLNRMVELATQSANGTYSDTVDREQLQKEIVQLKDEIDRIADSSNFNGIKLLDGSMSGREAQTIIDSKVTPGTLTNFSVANSTLPAVSSSAILGTDTVLHVDKGTATNGTVFSVDLHNVGFSNKSGETLTISIGGNTITVEGTGGKKMTDSELVDYIVDAFQNGNTNVAVNGTSLAGGANASVSLTDGTATGIEFKISKTTDNGTGDQRLTFTQIDPPTGTSDTFNGRMTVNVTGAQRSDMLKGGYAVTNATGTASVSINSGVSLSTTVDFTGAVFASNTTSNATITITSSNELLEDFTVTLNVSGVATSGNVIGITYNATDDMWYFTDDQGAETSEKVNGANIATKLSALVNAHVKTGTDTKITTLDTTINADTNKDYTAAATVAALGDITIAAADLTGSDKVLASGGAANKTLEYQVTGAGTADYNKQTTYVDNKTADAAPRLASTKFTLDSSMVEENSSIFIAGTDYVFTTDKALKDSANYVYIGDLGANKDGKNITSAADLATVADRLATAAKGNSVYTVGNTKGSAVITVTEIEGNDQGVKGEYDLKTLEGIEKSLGFRVGNKVETTTTEIEAGKKLTLQIGDTAEPFNQLSVAINDCHSEAIGIGDVDVSTQEGAAKAVEAIKNAINYVSDVRGTLGATQNRLDHTINNLSVMTENIQDAESTIRDVDVAEEMMAYTKNNILIQSAQAMLAQANQVPQGVLQLLQ